MLESAAWVKWETMITQDQSLSLREYIEVNEKKIKWNENEMKWRTKMNYYGHLLYISIVYLINNNITYWITNLMFTLFHRF